ncbi:MAG: NADH-quinone oxidoreductase subunit NuoK [Pirellulales bacterium]
MNELALLQNYLTVGSLLFGFGLVGFLCRRNMIVMFLSAEMMLLGVSISLVGWGRFHNDFGGQVLTIFVLAVAACEAAVALAVVLVLYRRSGSLDVVLWQRLRESSLPDYVDEELPEEVTPTPTWPQLPPAGVRPEITPQEERERAHV